MASSLEAARADVSGAARVPIADFESQLTASGLERGKVTELIARISRGPACEIHLEDLAAEAMRADCIDINALEKQLNMKDPRDVQLVKLIKQFDADEDGKLSLKELITAIGSHHEERVRSSRLMKIILGLLICFIVAVICLFAMAYTALHAYGASRGTYASSQGQLLTTSGQNVSVDITRNIQNIWHLPQQDLEYMRRVKDIVINGDDNATHFYLVQGFKWFSNTSMFLYTSMGDVININGQDVTVVAKDNSVYHDSSSGRRLYESAAGSFTQAEAAFPEQHDHSRRLATTTTTVSASSSTTTTSRRRSVSFC